MMTCFYQWVVVVLIKRKQKSSKLTLSIRTFLTSLETALRYDSLTSDHGTFIFPVT